MLDIINLFCMKKVDVIFPNYINAAIGPTGTLRRLLKNKEYLRARGYELEIFTYDYLVSNGKSAEVDFSKGLTFRSKLKQWLRKNRYTSILFLLRYIRNANRLVRIYKKLNRKPDIVVFHEEDACYAYLKNIKSSAKKVCFFHTDGKRWEMFLKSYPKLKNTLFLKYLDRRIDYIIRSLDCFVFIARIGQKNFLLENPGVDINKTVFFHNGIDDKPIIKREKKDAFKYHLCSTGSICERKGQYLIIEALHLMDREKSKEIHLSLFGTGPDLAVLQNKVVQYGLEEQVTFYGNVRNEEIHSRITDEDIFVLMSNNEGLPISIIEAMRAGLPIISTNISGIPEQVTSFYNGILIKPTVSDLVNVLNDLSKYDWKTMGENSRKRFENEFSFDQMLKAYCDMMDRLKVSYE